MAGYWPISVFACLWTEKESRFIIWLSGKLFLRDTAGSPKRARCLHLARLGSQSHRAIWFISPARGASLVIKIVIVIVIVIAIVIYATKAHLKGNTIQKERNQKGTRMRTLSLKNETFLPRSSSFKAI